MYGLRYGNLLILQDVKVFREFS